MKFIPVQEQQAPIIPEVEGWALTQNRHYTFSRELWYRSIEKIEVEYISFERRGGRLIDASYPASILNVRVNHAWNEEKREWWSSGSMDIELINPRTGEGYQSGWRAGSIRVHIDPINGAECKPAPRTFLDPLIEATVPHTIITVTETPA